MKDNLFKDKISFLIAAYNCENVIEKTIRHIISKIKRNKNLDFEIVIIDDKSEDNTYEKIKAVSSLSKKIKIFKNKQNLGFCNSIFNALEKSSGNYIKLMHCADYKKTNLLEFIKNYKKYDLLLVDFKDKRSFFRKYISITCNILFRLITLKKIKYFSSALMCKKTLFKKYFIKKNYGSFFLPLIISKLLIDGHTYKEIAVEGNQENKNLKLKSRAISNENLISFLNVLIEIFKYKYFIKTNIN